MDVSKIDKTPKSVQRSSGMFAAIYGVVKKIPSGRVMNYGTVATLAGHPHCARQVGFALHQNPDPDNIPCHRVVFKDGSLSPAFAFGGIQMQKKLLEKENVGFYGDKVDMKRYGIGGLADWPSP